MNLPEPLGTLVALGFTLLLVLLRLDAPRFRAAEYDEPDRRGRAPSVRRRIGWYVLGLGLVWLAGSLHPDAAGQLFLGFGDRASALVAGLAYGGAGVGIALALAWRRYGHLRLPSPMAYPGAMVNAVATALVDEAVFRGLVLGWLAVIGLGLREAIVVQALLYAVATRLAAPGRPRALLVTVLAVGFASGFLTVVTGGIGAAFLGHALTRIAVFLTTGHAGQPAAAGAEAEELAATRATPAGWRQIVPGGGTRER